jgi:dihydroorotate dehydrogenase (fumarate)
MTDLKTRYLGLELENPIIVGASNLVTDPDMVRKLAEVGASAIVYKTLFEEQIQLENLEMEQNMEEYADRHAEMTSLFPDIEHAGPAEHIHNLKKAIEAAGGVPIIASLNCVNEETWIEYGIELEKAGAAALEANFYAEPKGFEITAERIEDTQISVLKALKSALKIPVAAKISPFYSNPLNVVKRMSEAGADGIVMFNRLFQPEIDIKREVNFYPYNLSNPGDNKLPLRYAALLYGKIDAGICTNTGIMQGEDVIKMILAGADSVQIVSTLYRNKPEQIYTILAEIEEWMSVKGYKKLDDFRGKLAKKNLRDPFAYERSQYIDILMHSDRIFDKYPMT